MTPFLREITIANYKSIANCSVRLQPVSILVGPNGAGKSNFIDALRIVSEGLQTTLEHAIRQRGGIKEVRRRSGGHPTHFSIEMLLDLDGRGASFAFRVGALANGGFKIQSEKASIDGGEPQPSHYTVVDGNLVEKSADVAVAAKIFPDRLFLTTLSAVSPFRRLFEALSGIASYNINPAAIREPQPQDSGDALRRDGGNIASVIRRLEQDDPASLGRIEDYLRRIVPGIEGVNFRALGPIQALEFRQRVAGAKDPWRFFALNMSDGTLRSVGVLTALFQGSADRRAAPALVAIEEPESTIHPGAAAVLMDAVIEAARRQQVIVTTHSPDLLDHPRVESDSILTVANHDGITVITPIGEAARSAIRTNLFTAGELLRQDQLHPASAAPDQAELFEA
jgi:predicted ATPase